MNINKLQKQFNLGIIVFQFAVCSLLVIYSYAFSYFYWLNTGRLLANSFLAQGSVATHKATTTPKLHIEYTVLKVPTAKTTGAKK